MCGGRQFGDLMPAAAAASGHRAGDIAGLCGDTWPTWPTYIDFGAGVHVFILSHGVNEKLNM